MTMIEHANFLVFHGINIFVSISSICDLIHYLNHIALLLVFILLVTLLTT